MNSNAWVDWNDTLKTVRPHKCEENKDHSLLPVLHRLVNKQYEQIVIVDHNGESMTRLIPQGIKDAKAYWFECPVCNYKSGICNSIDEAIVAINTSGEL